MTCDRFLLLKNLVSSKAGEGEGKASSNRRRLKPPLDAHVSKLSSQRFSAVVFILLLVYLCGGTDGVLVFGDVFVGLERRSNGMIAFRRR